MRLSIQSQYDQAHTHTHGRKLKRIITALAVSALLLAGFSAPATAASEVKAGDCSIWGAEAYCEGPNIGGLKDRSGLTSVSMSSYPDDISVIETLPNLEAFHLFNRTGNITDYRPITAGVVESIAKTRVTTLAVDRPVPDLSKLSTMTQLTALSAPSSNYANSGASLLRLPKLETLRIGGTPGINLSAWAKSPSLTELNFNLISKPIKVPVGTEFTVPSFTWLDGKPFEFKSDWDYSSKQIGVNKFKAIKPYHVGFLDGGSGSFKGTNNTINWWVDPGESRTLTSTATLGWKSTPKFYLDVRSSRPVSQSAKTVPTMTELHLSGEQSYPSHANKQTCAWFKNGKSTGNKTCSYNLRPVDSKANLELRVKLTTDEYGLQYFTPTTTVIKGNFTVWEEFRHKGKVTGTTRVGSTLTATGSSAPAGTAYSYQWLREGKTIKGATKRTYALSAADVSKRLSVKVTARKSGFYTSAATSATTPKVVKGAISLKKSPTVSGSKKVGATLKSKPGTWSVKPSKYTYQWYRSGAAINKAIKATYKMTTRDNGKVMYVKVTAHKAGYTSKSANSKVN